MSTWADHAARKREEIMNDTACTCGHAIEEHGHDPKYPGSTACTECGCIAFEAAEDDNDE